MNAPKPLRLPGWLSHETFSSYHFLPPGCRWLLALVVVALWFGFESAHGAGFTLTVNASSGTRNLPGKIDHQSQSLPDSVSLKAESTVHETGQGLNNSSWVSDGASTANGTVGPGAMQLLAQAGGTTGTFNAPSVGGAAASVDSALNDSFVILAPDCTNCAVGRSGTLTFAISLIGTLGGGGSVQGDGAEGPSLGSGQVEEGWNTALNVQAGYVRGAVLPSTADLAGSGSHKANTADGSDTRAESGLGLGVHTATIAFTFGTPISLQWHSSVYAIATVNSTGYERSFSGRFANVADFSNSFAWGGVLSVVDETGAPVTGFTALNGSGVSYRESFASPVLDVVLHPADRTMTLSWASGTPIAFRLESTLSLAHPDWQPVVASVVESTTLKSVVLPISEVPSEKFFRLSRNP